MLRSLFSAATVLALAVAPAWAAWGYTTSGSLVTVDTAAGLVAVVDMSTGDITSLLYNGIQAQDQSGKHSQIGSGIGAACSITTIGNYIKITCSATNIIHYYVFQYKNSGVHMATYTTAEPTIGELRYIARLNRATLPNGYTVSDIKGGTAIEGSDVYSVSGQTRSKFYSSRQFIDDQVHGVTGSSIGAFMIIPGVSYETSAGGPFFRDINNQGGDVQELYFYMNSGHTQTETYRQGFFGPYLLQFTTGAAPAADYSTTFWEGLSITGQTTFVNRGYVKGTASGIASQFASYQTIGFSNSVAQYWVRTDSAGAFTSPKMKAGTYTMTLYKVEQAVKTQSVTVSVGTTVTSNIASGETIYSSIWQIGDWDGTPRGFLNADKIETMHPSDSRMSSWAVSTFTVGSAVSGFPMALFKAVNGAIKINFTLTSSQIGARTLRIGTTNAFAGGRPQVLVNSWTGPAPAAPTQPDSRGVTRGTWRGNNIIYTVSIPSGTLVTGSNSITISVISGSSGDTFLSPNFIFDAIDLY